MKFLRFLLITLVACLAALGIALAVALDSGVQTWAVRREIAQHGIRHGSVGSVSMGFSQTDLKDVSISARGIVLTLPQLRAEFPPLAAALSHRLIIRQLTAQGWTLDLRNASGAATAARGTLRALTPSAPATARAFSLLPSARAQTLSTLPEPFRGIFTRLVLPIDLAVASVDLEGDVLLPAGPGVPPATVHAIIKGGGLGVGQEAQFYFSLMAAPNGPTVVSKVSAEGQLAVAMDTPRTFTRFGMRLNAAAFGATLGRGVRLVADLSATRAQGQESYSLVLSGETKALIALLADVPADGQRPAGKWQLDVADEDLSPFLLGRILPNFNLIGEGFFDADPRGADWHLSGGLKADLDRLNALRPQLEPIGAIGVLADFDVTRRQNLWRVDRLTVDVQGAQPILKARSLQSFGFDWTTGELQVANASDDLLGLSLQALPPSWVKIFFPNLNLSGDPLRGEIVGSALNGAVKLRTLGSLTVSGLSVGAMNRPLLRNLNATFAAAGDYTPTGWQLEINSLSVSGADTHLLDGSAKFGRRTGGSEPLKVEGNVSVDLAALIAQPGIGKLGALSSGSLAASFSASSGTAQALEAKIHLLRITADASPEPIVLPDITADLRADYSADRHLTFRAPIALAKAGRNSSVVLEGALGWGFSGPVFEGTLSGASLAIEDAAVLGAPFAGGTRAGLTGTIKLALQRVEWSQYAVTGLEGELSFSSVAVGLNGVKANLVDAGPVTLSGQLTYTPGAPLPYAWNAAATVGDVDFAAWWKKFSPERTPPLEGKFKLNGQFSGAGTDRAEAWAAAKGSCAATSTGGTFRLLTTEVSPKSGASNIAASALRSLAKSVGSVIGRRKNGEFSDPAEAAIYTAQAVSAINYDQLSFTVEREMDKDVRCRDFALISPDIRLSGDARISYETGTDFDEQPLNAQLNLSARGKLAAALKYLGVLGTKPDDLGYSASPLAISVKGTLQKPDMSEMQGALLKIVADRGGDLLNKFLGK